MIDLLQAIKFECRQKLEDFDQTLKKLFDFSLNLNLSCLNPTFNCSLDRNSKIVLTPQCLHRRRASKRCPFLL